MRAAIMARVSTEAQLQGTGIGRQIDICGEYAQGRGWDVVQVFSGAESAYTEDWKRRPILRRALLSAARDEYDVLLVEAADRWARNIQLATKARAFLDRYGVRLEIAERLLDRGYMNAIYQQFIDAGWTPPPGWRMPE